MSFFWRGIILLLLLYLALFASKCSRQLTNAHATYRNTKHNNTTDWHVDMNIGSTTNHYKNTTANYSQPHHSDFWFPMCSSFRVWRAVL